jgi:hypothetical protein
MAERNYNDECGDHGDHDCGLPAGWGTDFDSGKCRHCRGTSPDGKSHEGSNNPGYEHGAFSDHFRSDLTDAEERALEAMTDHLESIDDERTIAAEIAAEALLKYKRSADSRFLREARQWIGDFNLLPNEEELQVGGVGGGAMEVIVERSVYDSDNE